MKERTLEDVQAEIRARTEIRRNANPSTTPERRAQIKKAREDKKRREAKP